MSLIAAKDAKEGDLIDLAGDKYADTGNHPEFEFEYQLVLLGEQETLECVRIDFEGGSFGFPTNHLLRKAVIDN